MLYKFNYYNTLIPINETNEYILYNSQTGGLLILDENEGQIINKIQQNGSFSLTNFSENTDLIKSLIEAKYIVGSDINEIESYEKSFRNNLNYVIKERKGCLGITIATTNICNMACKYCFEFQKENNSLNNEHIQLFEPFLSSILDNNEIEDWKELCITWYGGEPLLNTNAIEKLTRIAVDFTSKNKMKYSASIITNGILLTPKNWELLKKCNVNSVQVTIDGPKDCHDTRRPLKNKTALNYEQIINNLSNIPDGINVSIRINVDRTVANRFHELLVDLDKNNLWPQKYKQIRLYFSQLRTYSEANELEQAKKDRIEVAEFPEIEDNLRLIKLNYFNNWAEKNNVKNAKLIFAMPRPLFYECLSYVNEASSFVINADGYLYPCWEKIHDKAYRIQHISEKYIFKNIKKSSFSDRFSNATCKSCKYLPVCELTFCRHHLNERDYCSCPYPNEINFIDIIKSKYLNYINSDPKYTHLISRDK